MFDSTRHVPVDQKAGTQKHKLEKMGYMEMEKKMNPPMFFIFIHFV